jgi:hypothetical protein
LNKGPFHDFKNGKGGSEDFIYPKEENEDPLMMTDSFRKYFFSKQRKGFLFLKAQVLENHFIKYKIKTPKNAVKGI